MRVAAWRVLASVVVMAAVVCGNFPSNHNGVHASYSFPTFSSSASSSPSSSIFASYNITSLSKISTSLNSKRLSNASPRNGDENNIKVVYKKLEEGMRACWTSTWGYQKEERCDRVVHCPDASDELHCPCHRVLPSEYLCDSYLDCPDFSDELGCGGCEETEIMCLLKNKEHCVPPSRVCDGVSECDNGRDEMLCFRLAQLGEDTRNPFLRNQGYVEARHGSQWVPLCGHRQQDLSEFVKKLCNELVGEDRMGVDHYEFEALNKTKINTRKWVHFHKDRTKLAQDCKGYLVTITCGAVTCDDSGRFKRDTEEREMRKNNQNSRREELHWDEESEEERQDRPAMRQKREHGPMMDGRVVGGSDSPAYMWTFLVGIRRNGVFYCSGTLISAYLVLTAAHCVHEPKSAVYEVHAGMLRRDSWSPYEQTSLVTHILRHEHFNSHYIRNDLALFRLQTPMHLNRWVRPVCLSKDLYPEEGDMCTVAGWGNIHEDGEDSLQLQQVDLPILASCKKETFFSDEEVLCAGYDEGQKDACQGDSGGPLMCTKQQEGWVQVGLVSFGRGCARPGNAGVYVRLSYHLDWIYAKLEMMKDASNLPEESKSIAECRGVTCLLGEGSCLPTQRVCDYQADCLGAEDEVSCGFENDLVPETTVSKPSHQAYKSSTIATTTDTSTTMKTTTTTTPLPPTTTADITTTDSLPTTTTTTIVDSAGVIETCVLFGIDEDNETLSCMGDDYLCTRIPECLPRRSVCDGEPQCTDGTDELGCYCVDRLYTYGKEDFVCDGFYDCHDLSDEDCAPCGPQFVCALSQQCVPQEEVCDGKNNCRYGEDELFCIALINVHTEPERDQFGELTSQKEGRLVLRVDGVWDTICVDTLKEELGHRVCSFLGYETLDDLYYVEDSLYITPPSPQNHHTPRSKLALTPVNNFNRTDRSHREIRSTGLVESFSSTMEGYVAMDILEEVPVGIGGRKDVCRQVVFSCGEQKCGKVPLYFFTKVTPVWMFGGSPWAASVYVKGEYRCGATLVHPRWLITSNTCMFGVSPEVESVWVVMGSIRRFGAPMRVWGAFEEGRQVDGAWLVGVSDILLLKLTKRMPKTNYISHLCLPTQEMSNLGPYSRCSIAGMSMEKDRESIGVPFSSTFNCPPHHVCPDVENDFKDICMESWAGVVACQLTQDNNPTWIGVGVWSYRRRAGDCNLVLLHPLFTNEDLKEIHRIMGYNSVDAVSSAVCKGRYCVPGVCVAPSQECDGRLECFDSSDESPVCSTPITRCRTYNDSENCECPRGWWTCLDQVCIPGKALCDGIRDCADGEDELDCSCCKVLLFWSPEKKCDGQIDCVDQSDEAFCGCQNDSETFRCYSSKPLKCVSKERVCDETKDCPEGEDEAFCVTLVPHLRLEEDVLGNPKSYPSGFLMVRVSGKWFTYDYTLWKSYLSHLICLQLGFSQAEKTRVKILSNDHVRLARGEAQRREEQEAARHKQGHKRSLMKVVWIQCLTAQ